MKKRKYLRKIIINHQDCHPELVSGSNQCTTLDRCWNEFSMTLGVGTYGLANNKRRFTEIKKNNCKDN